MMIARNLRRRCASNSRNSDAPSSVQIRKCPIQPRQYSFSSSKQAFSDCPQERGVSSRILVLSLALVLVDSLTLTWLPSPILNRNPKKWTFSGERPFLGVSIQYRRRQPCQGQAVDQDQGETEHQDSRADAALLGAIAESLLRRTKRILPRLDGALPDLHRGRRVRIPRVRCTPAAKAAGDHHSSKETGTFSLPSPCETGSQSSTGSRNRLQSAGYLASQQQAWDGQGLPQYVVRDPVDFII